MKYLNKVQIYTLAILALYFIINLLFIMVQFIPNMFTLVLWGGIAPFCAIVLTWIILKSKLINTSSWIKVSSIVSLFFLGCGVASFLFINALWASI